MLELGSEIRNHDRESTTIGMLNNWTDGRRHQQLINLDIALEGWHHWAGGHRLTPSELDDTIRRLESADTNPGAWSLAHAVLIWTDDNGIDLTTPAHQTKRDLASPGVSLDLDM